ncbi:hypothetical protein D3C87_1680300 [compost metagenome]
MQRRRAVHGGDSPGRTGKGRYLLLKLLDIGTNAGNKGAFQRIHDILPFIASKRRGVKRDEVIGFVDITNKTYQLSMHTDSLHLAVEIFARFFMAKIRDHGEEQLDDLFLVPGTFCFHGRDGLFKMVEQIILI